MSTATLGDSIRNRVQSGSAGSANRQMHDSISNKVRNDVSSRVSKSPRDTVTRSPRESGPTGGVGNLTRGLRETYDTRPTSEPKTSPKAGPGVGGNSAPGPNAKADDVGTRALDFNRDGNEINPNNGTKDWNLWCLGWTNQATRWANGGKGIPELENGTDARHAYDMAEANGKINYGHPPKGAIVFFPNEKNPATGEVWGHVGISLGDGRYRGTVPASESSTTVGDRPIPGVESIPWMYAA